MSVPKTCPRCGRVEAPESAYWYAMGRLHHWNRVKPMSKEELEEVLYPRYCWSSITAAMDGPNGPEYIFGYQDCESRKK